MADLTTLAAVRDYLAIPATDTSSDAILQSLISGSSRAIQSWLQRDIVSQSYAEKYNGNGKNRFMPLNYPITAVASLKINGVAINPATDFSSPGFRFDEVIVILNSGTFTSGYRNIEIAYTAGYSTIPADLAQTCMKVAAYKYNERDWVGFKSKTLAGETVTFEDVEASASVIANLWNYRRVFG